MTVPHDLLKFTPVFRIFSYKLDWTGEVDGHADPTPVGAREKLKPRREPYWQRVRKGCFVGFRKSAAKGGG